MSDDPKDPTQTATDGPTRQTEIVAYAEEAGGTGADLDPAFEAAAIERWLTQPE